MHTMDDVDIGYEADALADAMRMEYDDAALQAALWQAECDMMRDDRLGYDEER